MFSRKLSARCRFVVAIVRAMIFHFHRRYIYDCLVLRIKRTVKIYVSSVYEGRSLIGMMYTILPRVSSGLNIDESCMSF